MQRATCCCLLVSPPFVLEPSKVVWLGELDTQGMASPLAVVVLRLQGYARESWVRLCCVSRERSATACA